MEIKSNYSFQYWWVNQNQTYKFEVDGGYMWSPKTNSMELEINSTKT